MSFIRTITGDVEISEMGLTYSHEHVIIDESYPILENPDFLLNDVDAITQELSDLFQKGVRTMIDAMPANCGRNPLKLAEVSKRSGIQIVSCTGMHLEIYYPPTHWRYTYSEDQLAELFIADIEEGIDEFDYNSPVITRTHHKAGLMKLATANDRITAHQEMIFHAIAQAHHKTGAPILTHTNAGKLALEQAELLDSLGVDLTHVVICHVDRLDDPQYHRDLLQTGVYVEYDSAFRWKEENITLKLLEVLLPDFPNQITIGMDAARNTYWRVFDGKPGLDYLMTHFYRDLAERGLAEYWENLMVKNPAAVFSFASWSNAFGWVINSYNIWGLVAENKVATNPRA